VGPSLFEGGPLALHVSALARGDGNPLGQILGKSFDLVFRESAETLAVFLAAFDQHQGRDSQIPASKGKAFFLDDR